MIEGVKVKEIKRYPDDRGFLSEIIKDGEETFCEVKQTTYTEAYPGVVKAFHWHKKQIDVWFAVKGNMRIVLHDLREDSQTKGETQVIYAGEKNPRLVLIPTGVAHGYQVLGNEVCGLFYHASEPFNPESPDEERIEHDDPRIGFDWGEELHNRENYKNKI